MTTHKNHLANTFYSINIHCIDSLPEEAVLTLCGLTKKVYINGDNVSYLKAGFKEVNCEACILLSLEDA